MGTLREQIANLRTKLENKENESAESIRTATNSLQSASLKLFEMAYKKVWSSQCRNSIGTDSEWVGMFLLDGRGSER